MKQRLIAICKAVQPILIFAAVAYVIGAGFSIGFIDWADLTASMKDKAIVIRVIDLSEDGDK